MKRFALILLLAAAPAAAQDENPPSLMERGLNMFLEGLADEMEPALDEFRSLADEFGPALRDFAQQMGPALGELMERSDDWSLYELPEVLPNGDIIIRRKQDAPPLDDPIEIYPAARLPPMNTSSCASSAPASAPRRDAATSP